VHAAPQLEQPSDSVPILRLRGHALQRRFGESSHVVPYGKAGSGSRRLQVHLVRCHLVSWRVVLIKVLGDQHVAAETLQVVHVH
jgi:hypothetical protein